MRPDHYPVVEAFSDGIKRPAMHGLDSHLMFDLSANFLASKINYAITQRFKLPVKSIRIDPHDGSESLCLRTPSLKEQTWFSTHRSFLSRNCIAAEPTCYRQCADTPLFWFGDLAWRFHILRGTNAPVRQSSRLRLVGRSTYLRSPGNAHLCGDGVSVQYSEGSFLFQPLNIQPKANQRFNDFAWDVLKCMVVGS